MREPPPATTFSGPAFRRLIALVLAATLAALPAHGLVRLNEGHDQIFVAASVSAARDSNVFASSDSAGDFIYSTSLTAEYVRRAGWIGVNASVGVASSRFSTLKSQDFDNPSFSAEFTKQSGRTTGSVTLSAARQSRADAATNLRSTSWSYQAGLNVAYPVIERFKLAGQFSYASQYQVDRPNLVDVSTYTAAMNLFYVYNTERDLSTGYRYRTTTTSRSDATVDHNFSVGTTGRLIRGLNGSVNVGYQFRVPSNANNHEKSSGLSASAATQYALNRKMSLTGQVAKDYSTTSTDATVDTLVVDLGFKYAYSSKISFIAGAGIGDSRFLGNNSRVLFDVGPPAIYGPQRHDTFIHYDAMLAYTRSERFKIGVSYSWFKNSSTLAFADFIRSSWNLHFDTRL